MKQKKEEKKLRGVKAYLLEELALKKKEYESLELGGDKLIVLAEYRQTEKILKKLK